VLFAALHNTPRRRIATGDEAHQRTAAAVKPKGSRQHNAMTAVHCNGRWLHYNAFELTPWRCSLVVRLVAARRLVTCMHDEWSFEAICTGSQSCSHERNGNASQQRRSVTGGTTTAHHAALRYAILTSVASTLAAHIVATHASRLIPAAHAAATHATLTAHALIVASIARRLIACESAHHVNIFAQTWMH